MKISRSREHLVNLGSYENVKFGGVVEVDLDDYDSVEDAIKEANQTLDELLEADMNEAIANVPEGQSTHAETWRR